MSPNKSIIIYLSAFLIVIKLDISFFFLHYETVDVNVYQDNVLMLHSLFIQNARIFHAIEFADEKEMESLLRDSNTDLKWTNEFYEVSVILYM